jgi:hypothetical protein
MAIPSWSQELDLQAIKMGRKGAIHLSICPVGILVFGVRSGGVSSQGFFDSSFPSYLYGSVQSKTVLVQPNVVACLGFDLEVLDVLCVEYIYNVFC